MSFLILPSSLALVIKIIALRFAYTSNFSTVFKCMLLFLALQNLIEAIGFIGAFAMIQEQASWYIRSYYFATLLMCAFLCLHVSDVSNFKHRSALRILLVIALTPLLLLLLLTDQIVSGVVPAAYALKSIHGPWFALSIIYFSATISFMVWRLILGYRQADSNDNQIRCLFTLVAVAPLLVVYPLVIGLQYLNYPISSFLITPTASTLFVVAIIYAELHPEITDIRIHLPFSAERRVSKTLFRLCSRYSKQHISYKDAQTEFEKALVTYSLLKNDFNVLQTAKIMNIDRSTLYSICKRLDITLERPK